MALTLLRGSATYQLWDLEKFTLTFLSQFPLQNGDVGVHASWTAVHRNETASGELLAQCLVHINFSRTGN